MEIASRRVLVYFQTKRRLGRRISLVFFFHVEFMLIVDFRVVVGVKFYPTNQPNEAE